MYHPKAGANGHPKGTQYTLSGQHPGGILEMPDIGSVVSRQLGSRCDYLPPYVMIPGNSEQAKESRTGFLPEANRVFKTRGRDVSLEGWSVEGLVPRTGNEVDRLERRRSLLT